jgi:aminoglycoside 3-N-acetyltransferase I
MTRLTIRKLTENDYEQFLSLIRLFEDVFEMKNFQMPPQSHLENLLKTPSFHVFVALRDAEVIAGLTIYTLEQYYATKPLAYIYDLAVKTTLQRQGVGKQLISFVKAYFKNENYEEIFVQADRVDDYALDFYRKTAPTDEEDVLHFYYKL